MWSMSPSVDSSRRASVPLTCTRKKAFGVFERRAASASRSSHVRRNGRDEVELPASLSVQRRGGQHSHVAHRNQRPARGHPWLALHLMQLDAAVKPIQRELRALGKTLFVLNDQRSRLTPQHAQQLADSPPALVALAELRRLTTRTRAHDA
jgi:hypothetical protein